MRGRGAAVTTSALDCFLASPHSASAHQRTHGVENLMQQSLLVCKLAGSNPRGSSGDEEGTADRPADQEGVGHGVAGGGGSKNPGLLQTMGPEENASY